MKRSPGISFTAKELEHPLADYFKTMTERRWRQNGAEVKKVEFNVEAAVIKYVITWTLWPVGEEPGPHNTYKTMISESALKHLMKNGYTEKEALAALQGVVERASARPQPL